MTEDEFWQILAENMQDYDCEYVCPVKMYADENHIEPLCHKFGDCADALMMLHEILQSEERQKVDIGLIAAKEKVRTEFP